LNNLVDFPPDKLEEVFRKFEESFLLQK